MKGLLRGILTLLIPSVKSEIRPVFLSKLYVHYKKVVVPITKQPQISAPFKNETPIAICLRRLNPTSVNFRHPFIFSLPISTLHRELEDITIPAWQYQIFKYFNEIVTPSIFKHRNTACPINVFSIDEFSLMSVIVQPISPDRVDYLLQPVFCQKFSVAFSGSIQPPLTHRSFEIVNAYIDKFESDEIAMQVCCNKLSDIHLNEHTLVKIESVFQTPRTSAFDVLSLSSDILKDDAFHTITASIKSEFANHSISTKIQWLEDFTLIPRSSVHPHSHNDPLLKPPLKKRNDSPPITHGGRPRTTSHIERDIRQEPPTAPWRPVRRKAEILCDRHGVLWRFMNENKYELQNFGWKNEINWFKLSGQNLTRGRLVKQATNGFYLLIVPTDWTCLNIESPCFESNQPEQLITEHWCGYFIRADQKETNFPRFKTPAGTEKVCDWHKALFALEGNCINDGFSRLTPLLGPISPKIRAILTSDWNEIGTIVLGEEGTGRNKARWVLHHQGAQQVQDLVSKYIAQRSGWYFLRFYDREDNLLESCDFRFVAGLIGIHLPRNLIIPTANGHEFTEISFRHNKLISIKSEQHNLPEPRPSSETETRVRIPPEPRYDDSEWRINNKVPVKIELNRLWWGIADEKANEAKIEWVDKPFELEESQFDATSSEALWLKLPRTTDIDSVYYGFNRSSARKLPHLHHGGKFPIVLRQFNDAPELREGDASLQLWITKLAGDGARNECRILLAKTKRKNWYCKIARCAFILEEWCRTEAHLRKSHPDYGFTILTYTEAQTKGLYEKDFPRKIYQCPYNPEHFVDATSTFCSPNSLITHHIERECQNARESKRVGPIKISFKVVDDAERIRQAHLPTLPIWVQCRFCNEFFKKSTNDASDNIYSHLVKAHRNEFFERK
jgi:hypothetical protein